MCDGGPSEMMYAHPKRGREIIPLPEIEVPVPGDRELEPVAKDAPEADRERDKVPVSA